MFTYNIKGPLNNSDTAVACVTVTTIMDSPEVLTAKLTLLPFLSTESRN